MELTNIIIVFDTNMLFIKYQGKTDYTKFYFNRTFDNILLEIEKLDIYEKCIILIPSVVWSEMEKQKLDAYEIDIKKVKDIRNVFPNAKIEIKDLDYKSFLSLEIKKYKEELSARLVKIDELALPDKEKFIKIVDRAFNKEPPFEGKVGESDKGFKDVLIWESILEYKSNNLNTDIIFYTNDKGFKVDLEKEFEEQFNGNKINIVSGEQNVISLIKEGAIKLNKTTYIEKSSTIYEKSEKYINGEEFKSELIKRFNFEMQDSNIPLFIEDILSISIDNIIYETETVVDGCLAYIKVNLNLNKKNGKFEDIFEKEYSFEVLLNIIDDEVALAEITLLSNEIRIILRGEE